MTGDLFLAERERSREWLGIEDEISNFSEFGQVSLRATTASAEVNGQVATVPTYVNEFWTSKQRDAHSLQEISYRACFKPQLPRFFIERLTRPGDVVYDPFMGRGTTVIEGALMGRVPFGCDINPLSQFLVKPRLNPPSQSAIYKRLEQIPFEASTMLPEDLLVFYHESTLRQIVALKDYLVARKTSGELDSVDEWIWMVALNRLTGHSPGFFSVYTLPPNQAVSVKSQQKINADRNQTPPPRNVREIILKKSASLLMDCGREYAEEVQAISKRALLVTGTADKTSQIPADSVSLAVTSPPFLDVVDYASDNWLRCWFAGIDPKKVAITTSKKLGDWREFMTGVFKELRRVLKAGGHIAFEVGEVRGGKIKLEETVIACGIAAGVQPVLVMINQQEFTKTANCWGVDNNSKGTNSNRIVVFKKD